MHSHGDDHARTPERARGFGVYREEAHSHSNGVAHTHGTPSQATTRDNSIRSAYIHVLADAFISVLAIFCLILAKLYGLLWMDPLAGIIGALVIANWAFTLIRDTAGNLLDVCPDEATREKVRRALEFDGDRVVDLHLWRLGPGHLGAVISVATRQSRDCRYYHERLSQFRTLSHVTVEVMTRAA